MKLGDRWLNGIDHNPMAEKLARLIAKLDFSECDDSFGFKFGGDGDNGEHLIYILDSLIDRGYLSLEFPEKYD